MNRIQVSFTQQELEALSKTVGIAIDNLVNKAEKYPQHTEMGKVARYDRSHLASCRAIISEALRFIYETGDE